MSAKSHPTSHAESTTQMATTRTRLALERTLMASVRTSVSLITFGFTLFKVFDFLRTQFETSVREPVVFGIPLGARAFGIATVAIGLISLLLATAQHWRHVHVLRRISPDPLPHLLSIASIVAVGFLALGGLALVSISGL